MGAWGRGILQNDTAQDGLVAIAHTVEDGVRALGHPEDSTTGELLACIGCLIQFSPYSLSPENEFHATLVKAIRSHVPDPLAFPEEIETLLRNIVSGVPPTYAMMNFDPRLERALHGPVPSTFATQKTWARPPDGCFEHPAARSFLQGIADHCVHLVDEDFADHEVLEDPVREASAMGALALLLILDPIHIDPARFGRWRRAYQSGKTARDPDEADFYRDYDACAEAAFAYGVAKFDAGG